MLFDAGIFGIDLLVFFGGDTDDERQRVDLCDTPVPVSVSRREQDVPVDADEHRGIRAEAKVVCVDLDEPLCSGKPDLNDFIKVSFAIERLSDISPVRMFGWFMFRKRPFGALDMPAAEFRGT